MATPTERNCRRPQTLSPIAVGFVISTGLLHLIGIGFGLLAKWPAGRMAVRGAGAFISLAGVAFLTGFA